MLCNRVEIDLLILSTVHVLLEFYSFENSITINLSILPEFQIDVLVEGYKKMIHKIISKIF